MCEFTIEKLDNHNIGLDFVNFVNFSILYGKTNTKFRFISLKESKISLGRLLSQVKSPCLFVCCFDQFCLRRPK